MANILFIATVYRTGEKVYPVVPELAKKHKVDVFLLYQMSRHTHWAGTFDLRDHFYKDCAGLSMIDGPAYKDNADENGAQYREYFAGLDNLLGDYDIAVVDNNVTIHGGEFSTLYEWLKKRSVPVVACPHGNRDFEGYRINKRLGRHYDYSFVFGAKERQELLRIDGGKRNRKLYLSGGIPANDRLKHVEKRSDYLLVIPSITDPRQIRGPVKGFRAFTKQEFDNLGILGIADVLGKKIVIKEKNKLYNNSNSLRDSLKGYPVEFVLDVEDDNQFVADAACVISAPSTMAFKSIQLGIPTVILKGHGMLGNFFDFNGLADCTAKSVRQALDRYDGLDWRFIENTLAGGVDFSSTQIYADTIERLIGEHQ